MGILAIIPAPVSTGKLGDRCMLDLCGKPMMAYTISAALESGIFSRVMVATDSRKYAAVAEKYGASVPFLVTSEVFYGSDPSLELISRVLDPLGLLGESYELFMLLSPYCPLRSRYDIVDAYHYFDEKSADSIVSVCPVECHPPAAGVLPPDRSLASFLDKERTHEQFYKIKNAILLAKTSAYRESPTFFGERSYAFVMDKRQSLTVEDSFDLELARCLLSAVR